MALTKVTGSVIKDSVSLSGNVSVGGTLTYQDVTNVDALGIGTFRTGIKVLAGGINAVGVITATSFSGSGANLTNLNASNIASGTVPTARLGSGTASSSTFLRGDSTFQTVNTDLVSDTSPQLGGNLDVNTKNILFGDSSDGSSDDVLIFGAGSDLKIHHDGSDSNIVNSTGHLILQSDSILLKNSASSESYIRMANNGAVELYYDNSKKLSTEDYGVKIHDAILEISDTTCLIDLMEVGSTNHRIRNGNGNFYVQKISDDKNTTTDQLVIDGGTGETALYFGGSKKLYTTSPGAHCTGTFSTSALHTTASQGAVSIGGGGDIRLANGSWTGDHAGKIQHANNRIYIQGGTDTYGHVFRDHGGGDRLYITDAGHVIPADSASYDLGSTGNKWNKIYASNAPVVLISVNLASNSNHSAFGVQTVYHYGSGVFQVVFAQNMPNDNYVTTASAVGSVNGDGMVVAGIGGATDYRNVGDLRMRVSYCTNNSGNDVTNVNLAFFANN